MSAKPKPVSKPTVSTPASMPQPQPAAWRRLIPVALLAGALFLLFHSQAAPGAWWGDGQELAGAAWTLGVPHPTGYPLYMLLGHVWMKLLTALSAGLDPGRALTLFSTACVALGGALLLPLARRTVACVRPGAATPAAIPAATPAALALIFTLSTTLAAHATFAEVYPLTFVLAVALLVIAFDTPASALASTSASAAETAPRPVPLRRAIALGLVFGLAALNHYSIAAWAPLVLLTLLRWGRGSARAAGASKSTPWLWPVAGVLAGTLCLAGYLYLPLRAQANPPLNWGDPSNLERLLWVLKGGQFTQIKLTTLGAGDRLFAWIAWWGMQWLPGTTPRGVAWLLGVAVLGGAGFGLVKLARARADLALGAACAIGFTALVALFYVIPDVEAYFLPAIPAAALGWAAALAALFERLRNPRMARIVTGVLVILPLATAPGLLARVGKAGDDAPQRWSERTLAALPPDSLVITAGDQDIYSLWYRQIVLGERRDVTVFGSGFVFSGWYARYFAAEGRPRVPVLAEDRPLPVGPVEGPAIANSALLLGTILPNLAQGRRVFITYRDAMFEDLFKPTVAADGLLELREYQLTLYPFALPGPALYELHPNPQLAAMTREQVVDQLRRWYSAAQRSPRPAR